MTLQELYERIDGDYEQALRIMRKEKMIDRYIGKLKNSRVYEGLMEASASLDPAAMFESAHSMKGVTANLGLNKLSHEVSEIADEFRPGTSRKFTDDEVHARLNKIRDMYQRVSDGIDEYEGSKEDL